MPAPPIASIAASLDLDPDLAAMLLDNAIDRRIAPRLAGVDRYTSDVRAHLVPHDLIAPVPRALYRRLTQHERRVLLLDCIRVEQRAKRNQQRARARGRG